MNEVDLDGAQKCLDKAKPLIEDILWAMPRVIEKLRAYEESYWKLEKEVRALRDVAEAAREYNEAKGIEHACNDATNCHICESNWTKLRHSEDRLYGALKNLDEVRRR